MLEITEKSKAVCRFINSYAGTEVKYLDPSLLANIVNQMGGVDVFSTEYEKVNNHTAEFNTAGFLEASQRVRFYKNNQKSLNTYCAEIAKRQGIDSAIAFTEMSLDEDPQSVVTLDDVGKIMFGNISNDELEEPNSLTEQVASFIVYLVIEDVCCEFKTMLRNE